MQPTIKHLLLSWSILLLFTPMPRAQHIGKPVGFAAVSGYGVNTTTGGAGGRIVVINGQADAKKLQDALDGNNDPTIIYIKGSVQLPEYPDGTGPVSDVTMRMSLVRSNKTLLGVGNDAKILKSGLSIYSGSGEGNPQETAVHNIIIQNVTFEAAPDDAINIQGGSHHIWVDHCTFTDGSTALSVDGQLDFKRGSDFLTVSYCVFTHHRKMSLIGHSNDPAIGLIDKDHLRATYDHNFFNDLGANASSRHPRVRWGTVHVLNCLIQGVEKDKNTEGVVSQCEARVFVEANYFKHCKFGGSVSEHTSEKESDGMLEEKNNAAPDQCASSFGYIKGKSFNPAQLFTYAYTPEDATNLITTVPKKAGVGKITITQQDETALVMSNREYSPTTISCICNNHDRTLAISCGTSSEKYCYTISDLTGKKVLSGARLQGSLKPFSIASLTNGMYLMQVTQDGFHGSQLFVKQ